MSMDLIERLAARDWRALARAISIVENDGPGKADLLEYACRRQPEDGLILGITGPGGAGKSTVISGLIGNFRGRGLTVGVIAVDPSSPFSGGAVLGDRVRMGVHSADPGVFIRSLGSRGALGGISRAAKDVLYLFQAHGFDVILVESLGVGQAETEITNFVDVTTVLLVPGYGDAIQMAKAGIQEIADIFVINKADKPEAELVRLELLASMDNLPEDKKPLVLTTVASEGLGVAELAEAMLETRQKNLPLKAEKRRKRVVNEIASGVRERFEAEMAEMVRNMAEEVLAGRFSPYQAARRLCAGITIRKGD